MTNDDKDLKPICSCGHPQSYPIPHRHDWTDREEAIIKHYEFLLRKTTPQQPSEPLKELDEHDLIQFLTGWGINKAADLGKAICKHFKQPEERKALSVLDIEKILTNTASSNGFNYSTHGIKTLSLAIFESLPAQREVMYPEKEYCGKINTALHNDNCEECKYHKLRNKLIDKMKKLNS